MELRTNVFDLWIFHKKDSVPHYLLLYTSQEKADKWFNGGRFWQIPSDLVRDGEKLQDALIRVLQVLDLQAHSLWAVEHTYIIYNRRREDIEIIPVFAAEVEGPQDIILTWEHSEYGWFTAGECYERLQYRGLKEGLKWTQTYVSETTQPAKELRLL